MEIVVDDVGTTTGRISHEIYQVKRPGDLQCSACPWKGGVVSGSHCVDCLAIAYAIAFIVRLFPAWPVGDPKDGLSTVGCDTLALSWH